MATIASAHNSYTGGYSGAPGMRTCASSCHGGSSGNLVVNGFPASYVPGQIYRLAVAHAGGSPIVNFNLTTRIGSTNVVGGSFAPVTNSTLYSGADGGVYANPHAIDSAVINWTAPSKGAGPVTLYAAAFQGTTGNSSGQSRALSITSTEIVTNVYQENSVPLSFSLHQNYPNPFNPSTAVGYQLSAVSLVTLRVFNVLGEEVATLVNEVRPPGLHSVQWDAGSLPSGVYYYRLQSSGHLATKKMILLR